LLQLGETGLHFLLVVDMIGDMFTDNQPAFRLHGGLGIVGLLKTTPTGGHDAGFFIGQVDLIFVLDGKRRRLRSLASGLLPTFPLTGFPFGQLLLINLPPNVVLSLMC
jgi:hypothetical protein